MHQPMPDHTARLRAGGGANSIARARGGPARSRPSNLRSAPQRPRRKRHGLQHPDDGRVLRVAARLQAAVRRPQDPSRVPAGGGRPDQRRRLPRAPAGARPQGARGARLQEAAGQGDGRRRRGRQPRGLRPRRSLHAGAAIPLAWRARAARRRRQVARALHVDHEHASAALHQAHPRPRPHGAGSGLYRSARVGQFDPEEDHAQQPGPAGDPPAGRQGQRAAGHAADQLQMRALRGRQGHADHPQPREGRGSRALRCAGRQDRAAGEAEGL